MSNEQLKIILGTIILIFLLGVFLWGPKELPAYKLQMLALFFALFAGLCGYLFLGSMDLQTTFDLPEMGATTIEASGGFAMFVFVMIWWNSRFSPVGKITEVQLLERIKTFENAIAEKFPPIQTKEEADTPLADEDKTEYERLIAELKKNEEQAKKHFDEEIERRLDTQLSLAGVLLRDAKYQEAEAAYRVILSADPDNTLVLNGLGITLLHLARFDKAEPLMRRALEIDEASFGPDHSTVATALNNLAGLLQATNRLEEAEPRMRRALEIDEASFGPKHPEVARDLNNLAQLLQATNRMEEAEPLMRRALEIDEAAFGPDHPKVAIRLNNLAALLQATNRMEKAEPLMRRALEIDEAAFGPDHPKVAIRLNNLAALLQAKNRMEEAEPLLHRALDIFDKSLGSDHPDTRTVRENLEKLQKRLRDPEE